jgi:hypothetical protein
VSWVTFPETGTQEVARLQGLLHRYRATLELIEELYCARGEMLLAASERGIRHADMAEWCGVGPATISVALHRLRQHGIEARPLANPEAELRAVTQELEGAQREAIELRKEIQVLLTRLIEEGWTLAMLSLATGVPERALGKYRKPPSARRPPFGLGRGYGPQ